MLIIHHTLHNNRKKVLIVQHTLENRPKNEILSYTRKANKNEPNNFGSFFYILVCDRTCDNARHCLHTPCAPARCAAGATLSK